VGFGDPVGLDFVFGVGNINSQLFVADIIKAAEKIADIGKKRQSSILLDPLPDIQAGRVFYDGTGESFGHGLFGSFQDIENGTAQADIFGKRHFH